MRYKDIPPVIRHWLGAREAFRRLGFKPEELFAEASMSARTGVRDLFLILRSQGKEFSVDCGPIKMDREMFEAEYLKVVTAVNSGVLSNADCDRIWQEEGEVYRSRLEEIVSAMKLKGFDLERARRENASCFNHVGSA